MIGGMWLLHGVGVDTPFTRTSVYMAVFGFGLGNVMQPITLAVQNAMPPQDIGVATSSATFFRQRRSWPAGTTRSTGTWGCRAALSWSARRSE